MCAEKCCHPGVWRDDVIQVCRWFTISGPQSQTPGLSELVKTFRLSSSPPTTCFADEDTEILGWIGLALADSDSERQCLHPVS